jgi:polar amino acid transport system substrate-binding protein
MMRIVLALLLVLVLPASARAEKVVTIGADAWCPVNCDPASDGAEGLGIELARRIFEPRGYTVRYVIMPWARALAEARRGGIDAAVGANAGDDPTLVYPQSGIASVTDDIYALPGRDIEFQGLESLKDLRLGVIRDYGYGEATRAFIRSQAGILDAVQEVSGDDALDRNIRKLLTGRIDALIESGIVMDYKILRSDLTGKIRKIGTVPQGQVYLGFSPALATSSHLARLFDRGMEDLRRSGELDALRARYGLKPTEDAP